MVATKKVVSAGSTSISYSQQKVATCRKIISDVINQYPIMKSTLGKVPNVEDIVCSQLSFESGLDEGKYISPWGDGTIQKHLRVSSTARKAKKIVDDTRTIKDLFWQEVILPHGVGQVMGWHLIKGWPDFAAKLPNGTDIFSIVKTKAGGEFKVDINAAAGSVNMLFSGTDALENGIRAALAILTQKYYLHSMHEVNPYMAIRTAIAYYLGNPNRKDAFGTTSLAYANKIMSNAGKALAVSQPTSAENIKLAMASTGPSTNSGDAKATRTGCSTV